MANQKWTAGREADAVTRLKAGGLTVLVYCRQSVSDMDEETGEAKGASLAVQANLCRQRPEFAKCRTEVFTEPDVSGEDIKKRPQYQRMMARLRSAAPGTIGAVAAYDLSRLHRNTFRTFEFMAEMEERGIPVFTAVDGLIRSGDELSWGVKALVASVQRKETGRRISESKVHWRAKGIHQGKLPVWLTNGEKEREVVVVEEAAAAMRELAECYATGKFSYATLADHFNQQGKKKPKNPMYKEPREHWSASSIRSLLHNPALIGKLTTPAGLIVGKFPAIIDPETWEKCQRVPALNRRGAVTVRTRHKYPLTPLLRCARCHGTIHGQRRQHVSGMATYYVCFASRRYLRYKRDPATCDLPWLRAPEMQRALLYELRGLAAQPRLSEALMAGLPKAVDPEAEYKRAMATLDKRITNIKWQQERGDVSDDEYVERVGKVNTEKQALRARLAEERKEFDLTVWEKLFAGFVAYTVAGRTSLTMEDVLPKAGAQAKGHGHFKDREQVEDDIEFNLWAERLPEFLERIEVDVVDKALTLALVPHPAWLPYFRKTLPRRESISFFRSKA